MANSDWNPWKVTTIGLLLSIAVALVTGLVVANWTGSRPETGEALTQGQKTTQTQGPVAPAKRGPVARAAAPGPGAPTTTVPSQSAI